MRISPWRAGSPRHNRRGAILLAVALIVGSGAANSVRAQSTCPAATQVASPIDAWLKTPGSHPLVGTILQGTEQVLTAADACSPSPLLQLQDALTAHLADGGLLLLGEIHDNGGQHALRAHLLDAIAGGLARQGRPPPAVVFEHIRADQAAAIEIATPAPADPRLAARELMSRLEWDKSGWPAAELFLPIFETAMARALPILSGHPTRAEVRDVARRGLDALPKEATTSLGLNVQMPEPLANALLDELEASHCGLMPRTAFTNMALAQRYRDAYLAASLASAASRHGAAILLAGNGHIRTDRGAPRDLARITPQRKVLAVAFIEVETGKTDAASYVPRDPAGNPAADYVVLTPAAERTDPCEAMRAQFKRK